MSAKRTAPSTPSASTAPALTSAHSSGVARDLDDRMASPQSLVAGQLATGLAHEPDRRRVDRFTPARREPGARAPFMPAPVSPDATLVGVPTGHSWTRSTSRRSWSGSVSGSTPWPRLKTWPGRPPPRRGRRVAASAVASHGPQERAGIEVALDGARPDRGRDRAPAVGERDPPVDADHVPPARAIDGSSAGLPVAKWISGTPRSAERVEQPAHVRRDGRARTSRRSERADPRVEQLQRLGAGLDLCAQVRDRHVGRASRAARRPGPARRGHQRFGAGSPTGSRVPRRGSSRA